MKQLFFFLIGLTLVGCNNSQSSSCKRCERQKERAQNKHTDLHQSSVPIVPVTRMSSGDRERLSRFYPKTYEKIQKVLPLDEQDIKNMTQAGMADSVIIHEIKTTKSRFYLTPEDRKDLHDAGVSKKVVAYMDLTNDSHY